MAGDSSGGYIPQIWRPQISGFWEMPKIGGPEKAEFRTTKIAHFQDHQKTALFWRSKKRPRKRAKKQRFSGPGKKADFRHRAH